MKHNNVIPNGHFKKHWLNYVKTWFNQPARRTEEELKKAVKIFSRPTAGLLRLVVHGQTLKYNIEVRAGRGFSLEELKEFQRNRSLEVLKTNIHWLKRYKAKLVIFPRKACKAGDSTPEELATATQVQVEYLPITREQPNVELVKVTNEMKAFKAYGELRLERTNKQYLGARQKRAAEAE